MDLREKPGKVQKFAEFVLRFRLIVVILLALACIFAGPAFLDVISYVLGATEECSMCVFKLCNGGFLASSGILIHVAVGAAVIFGLRLFVSGFRSAMMFLIALACVPMLVLALSGSEEVILYIYGVAGLIALILCIFVKHSQTCALIPLYLMSFAYTSYCTATEIPELTWGAYMVLIVADTFGITILAGHELSDGTPVSGAVIKAFRKLFLPILVSALAVALVSTIYSVHSLKEVPLALTLRLRDAAVYVLAVSAGVLPLISFMPLKRLRAAERKIKL